MKKLTKEIEDLEKDLSNSDMRIEVKEDYYNLMRHDERNNYIFLPEVHDMYKLEIHKNYYSEDEQSVLHEIIEDMEEKTNRLKQLYKNMYGEQFMSIGKKIKKNKDEEWER